MLKIHFSKCSQTSGTKGGLEERGPSILFHQGHGAELFCVETQNASSAMSLQCQIIVQGLGSSAYRNATTFSEQSLLCYFQFPLFPLFLLFSRPCFGFISHCLQSVGNSPLWMAKTSPGGPFSGFPETGESNHPHSFSPRRPLSGQLPWRLTWSRC